MISLILIAEPEASCGSNAASRAGSRPPLITHIYIYIYIYNSRSSLL